MDQKTTADMLARAVTRIVEIAQRSQDAADAVVELLGTHSTEGRVLHGLCTDIVREDRVALEDVCGFLVRAELVKPGDVLQVNSELDRRERAHRAWIASTIRCDGCGGVIADGQHYTDDEVCEGGDGPGFYLCGTPACNEQTAGMSANQRHAFYTAIRSAVARARGVAR